MGDIEYCSKCGHEYDQKLERCPQCGKLNPKYNKRRNDEDEEDEEGGILDTITSFIGGLFGK